MRPPFRTHLKLPTDAEQAGHASLAEALESMRRGEADRVFEWIRHPDERVRLALIRDHYQLVDPEITRRGTIEWAGAKAELLTHLYDEADREGVCWTPVIDAVAQRDPVATQIPTRERRARIADWARTTGISELRDAMQAFEHHGLRATLAEHGGSISVSLALEWAAPGGPLLSRYALSGNRSLTPEVVETLTALFAGELQAQARGEKVGREDCATGLTFLFRAGHRVSAEWLSDLFAIRCPENKREFSPSDLMQHKLRWLVDQLLNNAPGVREEHLLAIVEATDDPEWLEAATQHEAAGIRVWRCVLSKARGWKLKAIVADHEKARRDPELRRLLLGSNAPDVLVAMAAELPVGRFVRAIRDLAARKPHLAAQMIERAQPAQLSALTPLDLAPLLEAEDRSTRLVATMALGALRRTDRQSRVAS